jgi:hypothetical protein
MNDEHAVSHAVSPTPDAPDTTPAAPAQPPTPSIRKNRIKTWGEKLFDWGTYGGVALGGNEAVSLVVMTQARHGITKDWHARQTAFFKGLEGKKFIPEYIFNGHLFNVLIAVIGGMTMVPIVKYLEDHKGKIVRTLDRFHYGTYADSNPAIVAAHQEMNEAPKQTWGSLWKGRILTVVAAIGLDWSVGCADAQSNKLFKNNATFQKFANMDRLAERVSNRIMNTLKIADPARPTWDRWLKQGSWLLVFSSTLTVLFYASSKIFATRREQKIERRQEALKTGTPLRDDDDVANDTKAAVDSSPSSEKPQLQVNAVSHEHRIATAPQLAQAMP